VAEARFGEGGIGRIESRAGEVGIKETRLAEQRPPQISAAQRGSLQAGLGEVRAAQVGSGPGAAAAIDVGELRPAQILPAEVLAPVVAPFA
jgi:hypothetical protein